MTTITHDAVLELYQDVCNQLPGAADRLIEEMLKPIASWVQVFVRRRPQFEFYLDDLQGVAALELTRLARRFEKPHNPCLNPRAVILKSIYREISKACDKLRNESYLDDAPEVAKMAGPDYSDLTDLMLEIRQLCQSELEHDVVSLRSRGLADVEIAEVVGVVRQTVANAANRVEARYEASLDIGA